MPSRGDLTSSTPSTVPHRRISDPQRLATLERAGILDTGSEETFDHLTELAAKTLNVPVVVVSLVDDRRQYFKSCVGVPQPWASARETPLSHSLCQNVVIERAPLVIADVENHPLALTADLTGMNVGAYAGFPITTADGQVLGSFCAIDSEPRMWTTEELEVLRRFAATASSQIQLRLEVVDRTERIERDLSHMNELMDGTNDAMIGKTLDGTIVTWNKGAESLYGYSAAEVRGKPISILVPPGFPDDTAEILEHIRRGERVTLHETKRRHRDGRVLDVSISVAPLLDAKGKPIGASVIARDISRRMNAEQKLRNQEAYLRAIIDASPSAIFAKDRDGRFTLVNRTFAKFFGVRPEDVIGRTDAEMNVDATENEFFHAADRHVIDTGEPLHIPEEPLTLPGTKEVRWLQTTKLRFLPPDGGPPQLLGIAQDITERRSLEEQFRQSQKMEAIGQLSGGIAHDFNNMLTVILGNAQLLLMEMPPDHPLRAEVVEIKSATDQAAALTRQLLAFSRQQKIEARVLNVNDSVRNIDGMLRRLIGRGIDFEIDLGEGVSDVSADPTHIEQVLVNLCVNARDAMEGQGLLTIRTQNVEISNGRHSGVEPGSYVALAVSDTGSGIPAHIREHIFEPFFTTKPPGKGTGLGLSTVYGIVNQHGGFLDVESEVGKGTTFTAYFPQVQ